VPVLNPTSAATQDYVKAIYSLERRHDAAVTTTALAERLGVTAGSASAMMRRLADHGLAEVEPYRGIRLSPDGQRMALEMLRHHRLLELYLAQELGMPWDQVHAEAERLEHVISEELEALIAAKLGNPTVDPHGDPIPTADLVIDERPTLSLDDAETGAVGCFVRVSDQDPEMLRYLDGLGIAPGADFEVVSRQPFGGPLTVRFAGAEHVFGGGLAASMRVVLR
jgi:DtxR family Mn-dependent transcriptional regulator